MYEGAVQNLIDELGAPSQRHFHGEDQRELLRRVRQCFRDEAVHHLS